MIYKTINVWVTYVGNQALGKPHENQVVSHNELKKVKKKVV